MSHHLFEHVDGFTDSKWLFKELTEMQDSFEGNMRCRFTAEHEIKEGCSFCELALTISLERYLMCFNALNSTLH